jgi:TolB-like protein/Flp pilus assembly protein TadD
LAKSSRGSRSTRIEVSAPQLLQRRKPEDANYDRRKAYLLSPRAPVHPCTSGQGDCGAMGAEKDRESVSAVSTQAAIPAGAVFLSYASEDAQAAERIATALRSAGIEVWLDQSELRGGDAWDRQIRERIHDCQLFIALISAHTEARDEGYFRREWKLAVDRTHDMLEKKAFLLPVAIDATPERGAAVPDKFHEVQWTRFAGGQVPPTFVERVRRLLSPEAASPQAATLLRRGSSRVPISSAPGARPMRSNGLSWVIGAVLALTLAYIGIDKFWISRRSAPPTPPPVPAAQQMAPPATVAPAAATFAPPPHSIAVLPFVNMSGDKEQEYFSDGLTEELLNSLARINELQVSARTSSFSFKGKDADIGTIARKLNVGAILEGSVRRSGHTIRITAQLNNAITGFHLWSQTYDRNLSDVLKLQTEIANAVATALQITLLSDWPAKIELGGTRNPAAFDAYLRASAVVVNEQNRKDLEAAISEFGEAIHHDPDFALAYAQRSLALARLARNYVDRRSLGEYLNRVQADARKAIALAPDLGDGHAALARFLQQSLDFIPASHEYERALALAPGSALILRYHGVFAVMMGRTEAGLAALRRAVVLDPLNFGTHLTLGYALSIAGRYAEAVAALKDAKALNPNDWHIDGQLVGAYYGLGDYQSALDVCEHGGDKLEEPICLAMVYGKLGRRAEAAAILAKLRASCGDDCALHYASIYLAWGEPARSLDWLETALRLREPYLVYLKADKEWDPLRQEPRFQAIVRALKFPD